MKKTLIAVAVLAVSGVASAQVSVTGGLGFSYQKNSTAAGGAANHGMQMTDGNLNFSATEDLGGGMKITAASAFVSRGRDTGITARDASLVLTSGAAAFTLGSVEKCSRLDNVAGAPVSLASGHDSGTAPLAAGVYDLDGSCGNVDTAGVAFPMGPVTLSASYNEVGAGSGSGTAASGRATYYTIAGDFTSGNLALGLEFRQASATGATGLAGDVATFNDGLTTTRLTGSYNFGVATVGAGFETSNHNAPSKYTLSVAAPLSSAATVGLIYSNRAAVTADAAYFAASADAINATAIGVDYKLGKMTTINASYGIYSNSTVNSNEYRVRLLKSF
jgi:predicted porin